MDKVNGFYSSGFFLYQKAKESSQNHTNLYDTEKNEIVTKIWQCVIPRIKIDLFTTTTQKI